MDLILLVLVLCVIGFAVWLLTTKIPMPPHWATVIQVIAVVLLLFYLIRRVLPIPNIL